MVVKVLVTGGRHYDRPDLVQKGLELYKCSELIVGDCRTGADRYAREWAREAGVPLRVFKADWDKYGKAAGPIRNSEMVAEKPDLVLSFPGGRGTADCSDKARAAGIRVVARVLGHWVGTNHEGPIWG